MAMGIDEAGNECSAIALVEKVRLFGARIALLQPLHDLAIPVDDETVESDEAAGRVDGDAVHILDEPVGKRRRREQGEGDCKPFSQKGRSS